jgi:hypothetical protein
MGRPFQIQMMNGQVTLPRIFATSEVFTLSSTGWQDESHIGTGAHPGKHGGVVYRADFQCGRDRLSIPESLDVERVADILHIDGRDSAGLVPA